MEGCPEYSFNFTGFSQGIRRFSGGLGNLLAPLWAGGLVNNLNILIGVLLGMITLATVCSFFFYTFSFRPPLFYSSQIRILSLDFQLMLILSFKKLKPNDVPTQAKDRQPRSQVSSINSDERTPLLSDVS